MTEFQVQKYARTAGLLMLITLVAGGFGEFYVPNNIIVPGDATATAANVVNLNSFFRLGFAAYLVEAVCDISIAWIMYVLLRPVNKNVALLAAFFGLVSTAVFAGAELFYFTATYILDGSNYLKTFSPDQLNTLATLSLKIYAVGGGVFLGFYGIATLIRGYLIFRSTYLPSVVGLLFAIGGFGFIIKNVLLVLAPAYATDILLVPMSVGGLSLMVWLLVKGVDVRRWEAVHTG